MACGRAFEQRTDSFCRTVSHEQLLNFQMRQSNPNMNQQGAIANCTVRPNAGIEVSVQHLDARLRTDDQRASNEATGWHVLIAMFKAAVHSLLLNAEKRSEVAIMACIRKRLTILNATRRDGALRSAPWPVEGVKDA